MGVLHCSSRGRVPADSGGWVGWGQDGAGWFSSCLWYLPLGPHFQGCPSHWTWDGWSWSWAGAGSPLMINLGHNSLCSGGGGPGISPLPTRPLPEGGAVRTGIGGPCKELNPSAWGRPCPVAQRDQGHQGEAWWEWDKPYSPRKPNSSPVFWTSAQEGAWYQASTLVTAQSETVAPSQWGPCPLLTCLEQERGCVHISMQ